jgi:hypothetical protein
MGNTFSDAEIEDELLLLDEELLLLLLLELELEETAGDKVCNDRSSAAAN